MQPIRNRWAAVTIVVASLIGAALFGSGIAHADPGNGIFSGSKGDDNADAF